MAVPEFTDPRQVAIYDDVNSYAPGTQPDFYLGVAEELGAKSVLDFGCGTGIITLMFVNRGYRMIGVDPSSVMLEIAKQKPGADAVEWVHGGADQLGAPDADLALMTGHVAQFIIEDADWSETLSRLRDALRPGGAVAFESRDPRAQEWQGWASTRRMIPDSVYGPIESWTEVTDVEGDVVHAIGHRRLIRTDEELISPFALRFRAEESLRESLFAAGYHVESVFGDWDRRPSGPGQRKLIVVARRT
jgi:SAM-dependent methyltransferase